MLEHSIGDLAIHFVTWILGGRNLLIHYIGQYTKYFCLPVFNPDAKDESATVPKELHVSEVEH